MKRFSSKKMMMMDGSGRACSVCSQKCELLHGGGYNEDRTDVVDDPLLRKLVSFFKVMIDHTYSKLLFLPPKFARQISNMVDEKIELEDITKKRWTVTLSEVDGSLAFEKGWDYFSRDHNLAIGDLLVFEWEKSSHFLVQIFDRTGCPRFNFSINNNNNIMKRKRNHNNNNVQDNPNTVVVPRPVIETNYVSEPTEFNEETLYMINRGNNNVGFRDQEVCRRNLLFDLSSFEKPKRMLQPRYQTESVVRNPPLICDAVYKPPKPKERKKTTPWMVDDTKIVVRKHQDLPLSVKRELFDTSDVPLLNYNSHTMTVTWKGSLTLSKGVEDILTGLSSKRTKVILLRGHDTLSMPVLYHEGFGSKFIGSGWEVFVNENNIRSGDCVVFKLENRADFIFSLYDHRK